MLLGGDAVGISSDRGANPLVGGRVVVLPDGKYLLIVRLPAPYESSAMTDLNRQQVAIEESWKAASLSGTAT